MKTRRIGTSLVALLAAGHVLSAAQIETPVARSARVLRIANRQGPDSVKAGSAIVGSQNPGPTPFIVQINTTVNPIMSLVSVQFSVAPKPGSVTKPIKATYSSNYLRSRSYLDNNTGSVVVPIFGLYPNYTNTVTLTFLFSDGSSQQTNVFVTTPAWNDSCGTYANPTRIQSRTNSTTLGYDYMLVKSNCGSESPIIIDTDGQVRWTGPTGKTSFSSIFYANAFYIGLPPPSGTKSTALWRIEMDGMLTLVHDYANIIRGTHHNIDPGRQGMLVEVDTPAETESTIFEVDTHGNLLNSWNLADIISQAMVDGGDDPSQFVGSSSQDWFHNNAAAYRRSDNTLVVSSRENFVIALDYDTKQIKWILGDPAKHWYQFASLRRYALTLDSNSLPPIGQHAVSITRDDNLLLFDDGRASLFQSPPGPDRTYSAPRKYHINTQSMTAAEVWSYPHSQAYYSEFCSSAYEDSRSDYLIDYADLTNIVPGQSFAELVGVDNGGTAVFDYRYLIGCASIWNAIPIHLEAARFTSVQPVRAVSRKTHGSAGTFDIDLPLSGGNGIESRTGGYQLVVTFLSPVTLAGATVTPATGKTASISGQPIVSGNEVTLNLTRVTSGQTLTINLLGVNDGTNSDNVSIPISILVGDANEDRFSDAVDVSEVRPQSGKAVTYSNFRDDVNSDGFIDAVDVTLAKSKSGTAIP